MPKFVPKTQKILVGKRQYVSVLYIIPLIIDIHSHRFEKFALVSDIHKNVDLVLSIKKIFELEGMINSRESCLSFLNRSMPFSQRNIVY